MTALPDGVEGAVRRIGRAYDTLGRLSRVTSYDAAAGGSVVDEVRYDYDAWGNLSAVWQAHDGAVATSGEQPSPKVGYGYEESASAAGPERLLTVTYPDGRQVWRGYGETGGVSDVLGRAEDFSGGGGATYATVSYLGASEIVGESRPDIGLGYSLLPDGGLDALGRVTDLNWTVGGETVDRFQYGYDASGNRTWRQVADPNLEYDTFDEAYQYDALDRLTQSLRGTLLGGTITSATFSQSWTLDPLGNWTTFTTGEDEQTRAISAANEIQSISGGVQPAYDAAGNMAVMPGPDAGTGYNCVYDAWNRLVSVSEWTDADTDGVQDAGENATVIAAYRYDGLGERVAKTLADGTRFDYYYNDRWQVLEVRRTLSGQQAQVYEQYLWDPAYVDTPILRWRDADSNVSGLEELVYYTADANHNVTALVDASGEVAERYVYDAYGSATILSGDWTTVRSQSSLDNDRVHSGQERDAATGFDDARGRIYACWLGIFPQRDPARDGSNVYDYCGGRATVATDPSGLRRMRPGDVDYQPGDEDDASKEVVDFEVPYDFRTRSGGRRYTIWGDWFPPNALAKTDFQAWTLFGADFSGLTPTERGVVAKVYRAVRDQERALRQELMCEQLDQVMRTRGWQNLDPVSRVLFGGLYEDVQRWHAVRSNAVRFDRRSPQDAEALANVCLFADWIGLTNFMHGAGVPDHVTLRTYQGEAACQKLAIGAVKAAVFAMSFGCLGARAGASSIPLRSWQMYDQELLAMAWRQEGVVFREWLPRGSITQFLPDGSYPLWFSFSAAAKPKTIQGRYWMNRAFLADTREFGASQLSNMRAGFAPEARVVVRNKATGEIELRTVSKELHHAMGGRGVPPFDEPMYLREVWPWEHAQIDASRRLGYEFIAFDE